MDEYCTWVKVALKALVIVLVFFEFTEGAANY
jgi:hypothetical protein